MAVDPMVRPFLAAMAENDGVIVEIDSDGTVWGRAACPHIARTTRRITNTRDIDALVTATAFCARASCEARQQARALLAELAVIGAVR